MPKVGPKLTTPRSSQMLLPTEPAQDPQITDVLLLSIPSCLETKALNHHLKYF